jgi:hypothetical protein
MLSRLFRSAPPLDQDSIHWLFDAFAWSLRNLDARVFFEESILVTPTNEHFPGRGSSLHEMAELMFNATAAYAGMGHWPLRLIQANACLLEPPGPVHVQGALRGSAGLPARPGQKQLSVGYDPGMVGNPEGMIAAFAHTLAHHLGGTVQEPPPGGAENWPHLTEVVAVFLGFGLLFANSAYNVRVGCGGSCGTSASERENYLSQYDITYALGLFGVLKEIPDKQVQRHLKSSLRGHYKRCTLDIRKRLEPLNELLAFRTAPA